MSLHPIADKAEVSVDFPDKAYMGSFGRHSQFDAYADVDSVAIKLVRPGEDRREAVVHLHYGLLAGNPCRARQIVGRARPARRTASLGAERRGKAARRRARAGSEELKANELNYQQSGCRLDPGLYLVF